MHGALKNLLRPHASNQKPKFYLHFGPGWFWGWTLHLRNPLMATFQRLRISLTRTPVQRHVGERISSPYGGDSGGRLCVHKGSTDLCLNFSLGSFGFFIMAVGITTSGYLQSHTLGWQCDERPPSNEKKLSKKIPLKKHNQNQLGCITAWSKAAAKRPNNIFWIRKEFHPIDMKGCRNYSLVTSKAHENHKQHICAWQGSNLIGWNN